MVPELAVQGSVRKDFRPVKISNSPSPDLRIF